MSADTSEKARLLPTIKVRGSTLALAGDLDGTYKTRNMRGNERSHATFPKLFIFPLYCVSPFGPNPTETRVGWQAPGYSSFRSESPGACFLIQTREPSRFSGRRACCFQTEEARFSRPRFSRQMVGCLDSVDERAEMLVGRLDRSLGGSVTGLRLGRLVLRRPCRWVGELVFQST